MPVLVAECDSATLLSVPGYLYVPGAERGELLKAWQETQADVNGALFLFSQVTYYVTLTINFIIKQQASLAAEPQG